MSLALAVSPEILTQVKMRAPTATDLPLIFSSWLKSYRKSDFGKRFTNEIYFDGHKKVIERVLARSKVVIAGDVDDPTQIYGWVCFEENPVRVLHYVYVKQAYRALGIASLLIERFIPGPCAHSHEGMQLGDGSYFDPYQAFGGR